MSPIVRDRRVLAGAIPESRQEEEAHSKDDLEVHCEDWTLFHEASVAGRAWVSWSGLAS
jgi:hypothetical protein